MLFANNVPRLCACPGICFHFRVASNWQKHMAGLAREFISPCSTSRSTWPIDRAIGNILMRVRHFINQLNISGRGFSGRSTRNGERDNASCDLIYDSFRNEFRILLFHISLFSKRLLITSNSVACLPKGFFLTIRTFNSTSRIVSILSKPISSWT